MKISSESSEHLDQQRPSGTTVFIILDWVVVGRRRRPTFLLELRLLTCIPHVVCTLRICPFRTLQKSRLLVGKQLPGPWADPLPMVRSYMKV